MFAGGYRLKRTTFNHTVIKCAATIKRGNTDEDIILELTLLDD